MEDLWCVQSSGIDIDEFSDIAEYRRFLKRFNKDEENDNRRRLLYGDDSDESSFQGGGKCMSNTGREKK